ncbi:SDR family NAD(P)-dependent oxidoreductase [Roseomonas sp. CECT 9278]|uniref:SDR family NAD(P)-dependent oxidoreductase n=1 Tax=Roseomonas sp. CECT 9278 TaxID=2845823 RepID=UPI001E3A5709|nr:glucose 1-dehydrogenase [Roseomonas sp. CECT 9278]CAH0193072.1 Diacetyl reductase [(S)-acetoin forming] [Roseomonas sp. CECT 9278]
MSLAGQVALVTGGGSGIGEGIALRLARDGAAVVVADVNAVAAARVADAITAAGGTAAPQPMDVTDEAQVDAAVAEAERRFGRLRIAVCNAGITDRVPALEMSLAAFERVLRVNLVGCFLTARAAGRAMSAAPGAGGRIVTISSVSGQFGGTGRAAYGASKGGIEMLTRVLAAELAPAGILVNGVAPGPVQVARTAHGPRQRAAFLDRMAVKRYGTPADVAAAVAFLCGGDNGFVTGQILNVDGGFASSGVMYDPAEGA